MSPVPDATKSPPLDEVMLAMDVVDTLRHQRALVDEALDEDRRRQELIERIRSIYASQGIDVPESVIAEGVEALAQERFTYVPPERTFAVRLAEVWVERGRWARWIGGILLVAAAVWAGIAWTHHRRDRAAIEQFAARAAAVGESFATTGERLDALDRRLAELRAANDLSSVAADIATRAGELLTATRQRFDELRTETRARPLDASVYPERTEQLDDALEARQRELGSVTEDIGRVAGQLDAIAQLRDLRATVARALARLEGVDVTASDRESVDGLRRQSLAAIDAGDVETGRSRVAELEELVTRLTRAAENRREIASALKAAEATLDSMSLAPELSTEANGLASRVRTELGSGNLDSARQALRRLTDLVALLDRTYELRVVSRPGEQSGVWRESTDRRGARNHYVIVEAVDASGRPVRLPVTSEEDQTTREVSRFGIRVPESVYESIKADKLDNGIVDRDLFGAKRRGAREPEYRFEVSGGRITSW